MLGLFPPQFKIPPVSHDIVLKRWNLRQDALATEAALSWKTYGGFLRIPLAAAVLHGFPAVVAAWYGSALR